jgi:hypothetical protein
MPQHRVAAQASMMRRDVHGVIGPVLHVDDRQMRTVAETNSMFSA